MKKIIMSLIAAALFLGFASLPAQAMHCGKNIVSEGDHKYEVLAACGQPVTRETIGIDHKRVGEWRIVEEWLYIVERYGHKQMYLLRFDGDGLVREIKWLGEQK